MTESATEGEVDAGAAPPGGQPPDALAFTCPRCGGATEERFYGPCPRCVDELRSTLRGDQVEVVAPEYEPKMNVTPNAVALKED